MYAIHPIPLSAVQAVRKQAPKFGWQFIVVVLSNGLTLPPLYFTTGGVKALFAALKQVSRVALRLLLCVTKRAAPGSSSSAGSPHSNPGGHQAASVHAARGRVEPSV